MILKSSNNSINMHSLAWHHFARTTEEEYTSDYICTK